MRHRQDKQVIVFFSTRWGRQNGGVNSFNRSLATHLSHSGEQLLVVCVVPRATTSELDEASAAGVKLITLDSSPDDSDRWPEADSVLRSIEEIVNLKNIYWWVGHDLISGPIASDCQSRANRGKLALIMHASYSDYAAVKSGSTEHVTKKHRDQVDLFSRADQSFAVGPLLRDRLADLAPSQTPTMLVPGLVLTPSHHAANRLCAISFGRLGREDEVVKQGRLSIAAFAEAVSKAPEFSGSPAKLLRNPMLKLIGTDPEDLEDHLRLAQDRAGGALDVRTHPFIEQEGELLRELQGTNLGLFLSWHEGFGLAAWEAIGLGIPIILSDKTGLNQLLEEEFGGPATGCVSQVRIHGSFGLRGEEKFQEQDVDVVAETIVRICHDLPRAIRDADSLRHLLRQSGCTWRNVVENFSECLGLQLRSDKAPVVGLDDEVRRSVDLFFSFDRETFERSLEAAQILNETGRYDTALGELEDLSWDTLPAVFRERALVVRGEARLRLNMYALAHADAEQASNGFRAVNNLNGVLSAEGIINTILRDTSQYGEAVTSGYRLVALAEKLDAIALEGAKRKLARSLALDRQWQAAVDSAREALQLSIARQSPREQAKAYLAIGEGYRHGFQQPAAVQEYVESVRLAAKHGDWDCYLWSALALADSYFLLRDFEKAREVLSPVGDLLTQKDRRFPLETLHWQLSTRILDYAECSISEEAFDDLLSDYKRLGVVWVDEYLESLLEGKRVVLPKRS